MAYYVFDDAKNLFEGMTKEQIVNAIAAATGLTPEQIDADVITSAIKEQNAQKSVNLWIGTQNEYNAIETPDENTLYCVTDPHETNELQAQVNQLQAEINELVVQNTENATGFKIEAQTAEVPQQGTTISCFFTLPENFTILETAYCDLSGTVMPWKHENIKMWINGTRVQLQVDNYSSAGTATFKIVYAYPEAVDLSELTDIRVGYNGTVYGSAGEAVRKQIFAVGFNDYVKSALLNLLSKVAYIDGNGQQYYNALERAMYMTAGVTSITVVFNQGENKIYETDDINTLRQYLTVTAHFEDQSHEVITEYTLSGTLEAGTSTITASYGGKTATFNVTVTSVLFGYVTVGSPTITSDYRMTTTDGNFIKTPFNFDNNGKPWELFGKLNVSDTHQVLPSSGANFYDAITMVDTNDQAVRGILVELNMNSNLGYRYLFNLFVSNTNDSWNLVSPGNTSFKIGDLFNSDFYFKIGWTGSVYYIAASADGRTWDSAYYHEWQSAENVLTGYPIGFGNQRTTNYPWGYCVYINSLGLDIDGAPYWRAVKG